MAEQSILLFVSDRPVRSSLQFALSLDGFSVGDGLEVRDRSRAAGLVIDQACGGDGMGVLASLVWDRALNLPLERPKSVTTDWIEGHVAHVS